MARIFVILIGRRRSVPSPMKDVKKTVTRKMKKKQKGCCQRFTECLTCKKEIYVVCWDFEKMNEDEITLKRGEEVEWLKDKYSSDQYGEKQLRWKWCQVRKVRDKEVGFIPRSFLAPKEEYENFSLYTNTSWFIGKTYPLEARTQLDKHYHGKGSFVVCAPPTYKSDKNLAEYSLIIRTSEKGAQIKTVAFKIRRDHVGRYYIKKGEFAPNLIHLIRMVKGTPKLLPVKLRYPPPLNPGEECKQEVPSPPDHPFRCLFAPKKSPSTITSEKSADIGLPVLKRTEFQFDHEPIGQGNFGKVYRARWTKTGKPVAIKELTGSAQNREAFLKEAKILSRLDHENIIKLYGLCQEKSPILLVTEFMNKGSLEKYLRTRLSEKRKLAENRLLEILYQIARGMEYLSDKRIVHRDLAARNVLVSEIKGDDTTFVKICDFGLARTSDTTQDKLSDELPYKWMAPESLEKAEFTLKSDVWSFGVVLYEVMTHGGVPYIGLANDEILGYLLEGNRLPGADVPNYIFEIAKECWQLEPNDRPEFSEIVTKLDQILYDPMG